MSPFQYRAGGYGRQSKARESGSEVSTSTQHSAARARSDQMRALWVDWYEDLGISAFSGVERPDFERLIADCHSGRINLIIVYYISRLSRADPLDAIPIVTDLLNRGVTIVSVTEGEFRRGNLMDLIHLIMRLDAAHGESKTKSINVRAAKALARSLGGYTSGKPPYGFRLVPEVRQGPDGRPITIQVLAERDDEGALARDMFDWVLNPAHPPTYGGLAAWLNQADTPTRGVTTGKRAANSVWHPTTVRRILRDPRLAGFAADVLYAPSTNGRPSAQVIGYRIVRDADGAPVVAHPAVVAPEKWYAAQTRLDAQPMFTQVAASAPALLSSLRILRCECGWLMKADRAVSRGPRYRCNRPEGVRRAGQHTGACAVSMVALDNYVARRIFALIATAEDEPDTLEILAEATRRFGAASADPATAAQRGAVAGDLDNAKRALDALYDDREAGAYDGEIGGRRFRASAASLNTRIDTLTARLVEIDAAATPTLPIEQWLGEPGSDPIGPGSWWASATLPEQRAFVTVFVRQITVIKAPRAGYRTNITTRAEIEWVGSPATDGSAE